MFISITFAQPHFRKPIYAKDKYNWSIEQFNIGETFHYFVYVMTKGRPLDPKDKYFYCRENMNSLAKNNKTESFLVEDENDNFLSNIQIN